MLPSRAVRRHPRRVGQWKMAGEAAKPIRVQPVEALGSAPQRRSSRWISSFMLAILLCSGCGSPYPSNASARPTSSAPSPSFSPTDPVLAGLTPYPPERVASAIAGRMNIGITQLDAADRYLVMVDPQTARQAALMSRGVGNPDPNATGWVVWTSTGFTYLAKVTPATPMGPGGTPYPSYLVQVVAPEIAGHPGENTALVLVDARTGEMGMTFSTCVGELCGPP